MIYEKKEDRNMEHLRTIRLSREGQQRTERADGPEYWLQTPDGENINLEEMTAGGWHEGDRIRFTLEGGEAAEAFAVRQLEDGAALFIFTDCLGKKEQLHDVPGRYDGWDGCSLRKILNGRILERFPEEIRKLMRPFENGDLLQIPSVMEIFGERIWGQPEEDTQFPAMRGRRNRIAFQGYGSNVWEWYWLRAVGTGGTGSAAYANDSGDAISGTATLSLGVRPLFVLNRDIRPAMPGKTEEQEGERA